MRDNIATAARHGFIAKPPCGGCLYVESVIALRGEGVEMG